MKIPDECRGWAPEQHLRESLSAQNLSQEYAMRARCVAAQVADEESPYEAFCSPDSLLEEWQILSRIFARYAELHKEAAAL